MIWKVRPTLEMLNGFGENHMGTHLGIIITEIGDDFIKGTMPVDERTRQPFGILHGGASCVLAETLGSIGGSFCCDPATEMVVGLEINANHIKSARNGLVTGLARPIHLGKSTQVWEIRIENEGGGLVCISRLTVAVRKR
ncbi:MAG: hotdog fold thioesterase [Chitinophagales bacterium]